MKYENCKTETPVRRTSASQSQVFDCLVRKNTREGKEVPEQQLYYHPPPLANSSQEPLKPQSV
jgi:hypothetical protein